MARPTKLTPELRAKIADAVLHGATYRDSAEANGIDYSTFNLWMDKGRNGKAKTYVEFLEAVSKASAECAINFTRVIQTAAAKGDWKAAETWLKRRRREDWGDAVDVTSDGKPLNIIIQKASEQSDESADQ